MLSVAVFSVTSSWGWPSWMYPYCWTVERNGSTKCERRTESEGLGCVEDGPKHRIKVAHFKTFAVLPTPLDPSIRMLRPGLRHCPTTIRDIWDLGCSGGDGAWGKLSATDVIATCNHEKSSLHAQLTHQEKSTHSKNQAASQPASHQRVYKFSHSNTDPYMCQKCTMSSI